MKFLRGIASTQIFLSESSFNLLPIEKLLHRQEIQVKHYFAKMGILTFIEDVSVQKPHITLMRMMGVPPNDVFHIV